MASLEQDDPGRAPRLGIRGRLVGLLGVPLVVLAVLTGAAVVWGSDQAATAADARSRTELALLAQSVATDLQVERAELIRTGQPRPELRARIRSASAELQRRGADGPLADQLRSVERRLAAAALVADRAMTGAVAVRVHSDAVEELLALASAAIDPDGASDDAAASVTDLLARAAAASTEERDLVTVLLEDDMLDARGFADAVALASAQGTYLGLAAEQAPGRLAGSIRQLALANAAAGTARQSVYEGSPALAASWLAGLDRRGERIRELQEPAATAALRVVADQTRRAGAVLLVATLAALAIGLASVLLLRRALRSIARPLQELASQAEDVARTHLPAAVQAQQEADGEAVRLPSLRATGTSEVRDVARAFNEVQHTALRLAGEQAALRRNQAEALTNLGRRNQMLVARQLDYLSELESSETDPAFLEHLFRLDHLASRLRRNAESLLILAGSDTPRRRRGSAEVAEIVRAAMGEVEGFERVRLGNLVDAAVAGPVVIDLVHLLAELLENAIGFSGPDTTVEVDGRPLAQGGYQFAIIDHGLGMPDVELTAANRRLGGADEVPGMPTRYLGQYVVAKLAARIGALVRLQPSSGGRGVTAMVILPDSVLVGARDRSVVAQPLPGSRAARAAGPVPYAPGAPMEPAEPVVLEDLEREVLQGEIVRGEVLGGAVLGGEVLSPWPDAEASTGTEVEQPAEPAEPPVAPTFRDAVPWLAATPDPDIDPWEAFVAGTTPTSLGESVAPTLTETPTLPRRVVPETAPASTGGAGAGAASDGSDRGGLARRVPGATLADAPVSASPSSVGAPERSADGVASMLSAFQAGRRRGRDEAAGPFPVPTITNQDLASGSVHDGGSPQ